MNGRYLLPILAAIVLPVLTVLSAYSEENRVTPSQKSGAAAWSLWGLDLSQLQERGRSAAWADTVSQLRSQVRDLKTRGVRIPLPGERSGWAHNFVCPQCSVRLTFDRDSDHEHRCPLCAGAFRSKDLDEAWIYILNLRQIHAARAACVLAAISADGAAADLAKQVLLGYGRRYPEYQEHGRWAGKGRLQGQSLCEAVWMLPAVQVYRFLRENGLLTEGERTEIGEQMFGPALQLLKRQTSQVHNIHVWHAAAILALADATGQPKEIAFAEGIVKLNLEQGVLPDGSWYEGSPHYHFYTLEAFTEYALAARAAGRPLLLAGQLQKMFASPLQLLLPDRTLPLLNDGWEAHPLASRASNYEMGQHLFGGFEGALSTLYRECGAKRSGTEAFLYGPPAIPETRLELKSLATIDGVALVRRRGIIGLLKATPPGGGHDHPDKPGLYLFREGCGLKAADIGNPGYGNPLHREYYRTTAAHNTVMVDGKDQTLAPAKILLARETAPCTVVQALTEGAYEGVALRRTVLFGDGWAFDWTACRSAQEHTYAWLFHANGPLRLLNEGLRFGAEGEPSPMVPNRHLTAQRRVQGLPPELRGEWSERGGGKGRLCVQFWPAPPGVRVDAEAKRYVGVAESPDLPATLRRGVLLAGGHAKDLDFHAFFCWGAADGKPVYVARLLQAGPKQLRVEIGPRDPAGGKRHLFVLTLAGEVEVQEKAN